MQQLVEDAQINLLPSLTTTGIKLKLLHALFSGRHCIVNTAMVDGTVMENACTVAEDEQAFAAAVQSLYHQPFTNEAMVQRQALLEMHFDNRRNAALLMKWIWGSESYPPDVF